MLEANGLKAALLAAMNEANTPGDAHTNFTNALQAYIKANAKLAGAYVGTIPGPSPDPLNGSYIWNVLYAPYSAAALQAGAESGLGGWCAAMTGQLSLTSFSGGDDAGIVTVSVPTLITVSGVSIDFPSRQLTDPNDPVDTPEPVNSSIPDEMAAAFGIVAAAIVSAMTSGIPTPASSAATSSGGGVGLVTWGAVS